MKFSALLNDPKAIETLNEALQCASRFNDLPDYYILLAPQGMSFICATPVRFGCFVELRLTQAELFSRYVFEGLSKDKNVIIFKVNKQSLLLLFQQQSDVIRFKLTKQNDTPNLNIELKTAGITSTLPVDILVDTMDDYLAPRNTDPGISLSVVPMQMVLRSMTSLHQLKIKSIKITVNPQGFVKFCAAGDNSNYNMTLEDLNVMDDSNYEEPIVDMPFGLDMLHNFFSCFQSSTDRFTLKMSHTGLLQLHVRVSYMNVFLVSRCLVEAIE